jgi:peptidoglycan-associated lipoprotein
MTTVAAVLALAAVGCQSTGGSESRSSGGTGSEFREAPTGSELRGGESGTDVSSLQRVYFDYDAFTIRSDAKSALRDNAQAIGDHEEWGVITIEGHCDERGSEEYNLALGERRANGVKRYLVDLGVPLSRLRTVSFGEVKPSVMGHDESAWRHNRRSDFTARR